MLVFFFLGLFFGVFFPPSLAVAISWVSAHDNNLLKRSLNKQAAYPVCVFFFSLQRIDLVDAAFLSLLLQVLASSLSVSIESLENISISGSLICIFRYTGTALLCL